MVKRDDTDCTCFKFCFTIEYMSNNKLFVLYGKYANTKNYPISPRTLSSKAERAALAPSPIAMMICL